MSSEKSDKYIKETLHNYESPVDAEALWQAVKPPRRRSVIWWWITGALLLLLSAGGWFWLDHADVSSSDVVGMEGSSGDVSTEVRVKESRTNDPVAGNSPDHSTVAELPAAQESQPMTTQTLRKPTETTTLNERENRNIAIPGDHTDKAKTLSQASSVTQPVEDSSSPRTEPYRMAEQTVTPRTEQVLSDDKLPSISEDESTVASADLPTKNTEATVVNEPTDKEEDLQQSSAPVSGDPVDLLPTLALGLSSTPAKPLPSVESGEVPSPRVKRKVSPWSAQLSGGLYRLSRSFTMNDSLPHEQLDFRRQTEQPLEAISAELSLVYEHPSRFRLRTGLGWTSINTVFETNQMSSQIDTVIGIQAIYLSPAGDTTTVEGPIAAYQTIAYRKKHYNRIQHWDIPVLVGYQWSVGSWQLLIEGGVRFNLTQSVSGEVLDPELNRIDLSESNRFRSRLGLSYQAGVGVGYALSPRLSVRADMNLRYFPQDFTPASAAIGERYQLLGGQLGVQYRF